MYHVTGRSRLSQYEDQMRRESERRTATRGWDVRPRSGRVDEAKEWTGRRGPLYALCSLLYALLGRRGPLYALLGRRGPLYGPLMLYWVDEARSMDRSMLYWVDEARSMDRSMLALLGRRGPLYGPLYALLALKERARGPLYALFALEERALGREACFCHVSESYKYAKMSIVCPPKPRFKRSRIS